MKNIFKNIVLFVGVFAFSFEANGASEYPEGYDVVTGLSGSVSVSGTISNKAYIDNNISNSIFYFDGSTVFNAQNVYFANNINSGDWGGALFYASSHEAALENAVFIGNKIRFGGGAINLGGNITLKGTNRFDNNEVMETSDSVVTGGGAIRVAYGTITFGDGTNSSESVFSGNKVKVDDSSYGYNDIFMIGYGGIDDNTYGNNIVVKNNAKIVLDGGIAEMTIGASNTTVEEGGSIEFNNSGSGYTSYIGNILNNAGTVKGGANELEFSNTVTNSGTIYGSSANATNFVGRVTNTGTIVNTQGNMHFADYISSSGGSVDNRGTITFEKDIALGGANNYNSGTIIVGDDNIDGAEIGGNEYSEFLKLNNDTVINGNGSIVIKQDGRFKAFKEDATGNYNYVVHNSIDNEGNIVVDTGATLTATNGLVHNSLTANQWLINHGTLNATNAKIYGYTKNNGILSLFGNENVIERDLTGENIGTINVENGATLLQKGDVSGSETSVGNYNIKNGGTVNIDGDVSIYNVISNAGNISINENDVLRLYQGSSSGEIANSGQFIIEANPNYVPNPNYGEVDGGNESVDESGRTSFDLVDSAKVSGVGSLLVNNNASLKVNGSNIVVENEIYNKGTIDVAQGSEFTATGGLYHYLESGSGEWFRNAGVANLTNFHAYGNITNSLTNQATDGNYINGIMNLYGTDNVFSAKIGNNANTVGENVGQAQINIMDEAVLTLINEVDFDYDEDGKIVGEGAITGGGVVNIKEGGTLTIGIKNHDTNGDGIIEKDEDNVANVKIFHNINNEGTILVGNGNEKEKENLTLGKSFIQGAKGLIKTLLGGKITFIDIFENNGISSETADNGIQNQGEMQFNKELINKGSIDNSGNLIAKSTITNSGDIDNSGVMEDVSIIENSGTVSNSGTMEVATLDNQSSGRIDNTAGTMTVTGTLTNSGTVSNIATIEVATLDNQSSGRIDNTAGTMTVTGTLTNSGAVSNSGTMEVATLDNSGTINGSGSLSITGGTISTSEGSIEQGTLSIATGATLNNTGSVTVGTLNNSGSVTNSSIFTVNGITTNSGTVSNSGTMEVVTLDNQSSGKIDNTAGSVTVGTLNNSGNVTNSSIFTVNGITTNSGTVSNNGTMSLSNLLNENTINNSSILVMKGNSVNNGNINNMLTLEIFDSMALNDNSKIDGTGNFTIKEGTNIFANNTEIANKVNNLGNIFINQAKVLNIANDLIMNNASSLNLGLASKLNISGNYNAIGTPVMSLAVQIVDNALNHGQVTIGGNVSGITNVLLQFANDNIDASLSQEVANAGLSSAFVVANNDTLGTASSFNLWRISGATSTTNEQLNNVGAIYDWKILHNVNGNENGNVWYIGLEKTEQTPPEGGDDSGNTGGEGGNEGGETPGISGGYYAEIPAYVGVYSSLIEQHRSVTNSVLKGVTCSHHRLCRKSDDNRRRAWIDTIYERSNIDEIADIDAKISGTTIGLDLYRDYEKTLGLFGSYRDGSYSLSGAGRYYSNVGSKIEDKSWLLGSYYQYVKEGVEWLTTLFAGKHSLEINTKDGVLADTHAKEYGASFNVSKKYYDLENWSFIPNMELRYSYLSVDDLNDNAGKRAYFESLSYLESKFAIRAEYKPSNLTDTSSVYIEPSINYIHATGGKLDISNLKNVSTYGDELYGRLEMGGTYNFTSKLSIYGNSGYSKGDDYEEYDIMLGINYSF